LLIFRINFCWCFRQTTYTDNREIEGRIFHVAKQFQVPLFEKDLAVEKNIESLYRVIQLSIWNIPNFLVLFSPNVFCQNFKIFLKCKTDDDKMVSCGAPISATVTVSGPTQQSLNKLIEQLTGIDKVSATYLHIFQFLNTFVVDFILFCVMYNYFTIFQLIMDNFMKSTYMYTLFLCYVCVT